MIGRKTRREQVNGTMCFNFFFFLVFPSSGLDVDITSHQEQKEKGNGRPSVSGCKSVRQVHFQLCAADVGGQRDGGLRVGWQRVGRKSGGWKVGGWKACEGLRSRRQHGGHRLAGIETGTRSGSGVGVAGLL